jgi:hypothetical protein
MRMVFAVLASSIMLAGALFFGPALRGAARSAQTGDSTAPVPVLVELFTSEGCSSCPPADRVLATLIAQQPVSGALVIGLSEHVDYWDHQGWRDPYSWSGFTDRQRVYAREKFGSDQIYTPQLVVGGEEQLIGSDYPAALRSIAHVAASASTVDLTVAAEERDRSLDVHVTGATRNSSRLDADVDVWVAVTEDGLSHPVTAGENTGRTLAHTAVVRKLASAGRWPRPAPHADLRLTLTLDPAWRTDHLRVVAFAQARSTRRVLGAAGTPARPPRP